MSELINRTKIVATLGPACGDLETLTELIKNGVNVCRINFSHGEETVVRQWVDNIREVDEKLGTSTAILADLQGPKIRIGEVAGGEVMLENGHELIMTTKESMSDTNSLYISYQSFAEDVKPGDSILINDGKLVLEALSSNGKDEVKVKVIHGGPLSSKKGVNLPNTAISLPSLTEKDQNDLALALELDVHWIALSFVRHPFDVYHLREFIKAKRKDALIISKIEKPEAVSQIDAIIEASDGVMVARGDLGVEIPMQEVPLIQKEIVRKCRRQAKPVIIATQMMESMIENITPTRAEVSDVANAVTDGADAVMLSGETSVGKFPVDVIKAMYKIILETESFDGLYFKSLKVDSSPDRLISDEICVSAVRLSQTTDAKAIATMTFSGYTGYKIASMRPKAPIYVFTGNKKILNTLSLLWGTKTVFYNKFSSTDQSIEDIRSILKREGHLKTNDIIVNTAAMPIKEQGKTNMLRISTVI